MKKIKLIILFLSSLCFALKAQNNPGYIAFTGSLTGANVTATNSINFTVTDKTYSQATHLRQRNKSAKLYMKLDLGNDYIKQDMNWGFKIAVELQYQFSGTVTAIAKTLTINTTSPEILKADDVLSYFSISSPSLATTITSVTITDLAGAALTGTATALLQDYISNNLRLTITLAREYDMDVRLATSALMSNAPIAKTPTITSRLVTFSWQPGNVDAYPNYELQVLKLNNTNDAYKTSQDQVETTVDWTAALKVETQSYTNSINITLGEGTGYYIWRVRAIGDYFTGGIANSENFGQWSYAFPDQSSAPLNKNTLLSSANPWPFAFYFNDPDEKINWIYNRVFTEGDRYDKANPTGVKASEGINYADGLQRVRQNQKYNSSENTKIMSQTINDYNGRPALTTIPVPVAGRLSGYTYSLVTNANDSLYTAAMFDGDTKINNPDKVKDNGSRPYTYYSNTTTLSANTNVAGADGYPFKRTVFTTDGTGRVAEESGVGKTHALGSQANGRGRTTRILYSTPTDDELVRIFGDEAPLAESVIKTITIDQNNVMSVTYTSKEGKTIATALTSEDTDNLSSLQRSAGNLTLTNTIDQNVNANGKIVASKRIAVTGTNTPLTLNYSKNEIPGNGSGCGGGDCNFKMRLYIVDLNQNTTYVSDASTVTGHQDFSIGSGAFSFSATPGWKFMNTDTLSATTITVGGSGNQVTLNAGEYLFIKEIFTGNGESYADSIVGSLNDATRPIMEAIAAHLQGVNSADTYTAFAAFMSTLSAMTASYNAGTGGITTATLLAYLGIDDADTPTNYVFPHDFNPAPITTTASATTNNLQIATACCGTLSALIPKLPFCVLCDGSPAAAYQSTATISNMSATNSAASATVATPYGFNDFVANTDWDGLSTADKLTAVNSLVEREFIIPLKTKMDESVISYSDLWKLAPGFSFESLNYMFSNMLISQYYTGSAIKKGSSWYPATPLSTGGYTLGTTALALTSRDYDYNYDCKQLYEAWAGVLETIGSYEVSDNTNIVSQFNNNDGQNSAQNNADDDDNWEDASRRQKRKMKKALGQTLEDYSNSGEGEVSSARQEALSNIVNTFMDIAGYQFAAIIDGSTLPNYLSSSPGIYPDDYSGTFTLTPSGLNQGFYLSSTVINGGGSSTYSNTPLLFEITQAGSAQQKTVDCGGIPINELYYPYILRPEWMFKYFIYNVYENNVTTGTVAVNYIDDANVLIPHQVVTDMHYNYNAPASYLAGITPSVTPTLPLCSAQPTVSYSSGTLTAGFSYEHPNWTMQERSNFYDAIKSAPRCPANKGVAAGDDYYDNPVDLPTCEPKDSLIAHAIKELDNRLQNCYGKKENIKFALTTELLNSCYSIVACKTASDQVTEKEIELMAIKVIKTMTTQIAGIKSTFTAITLPPSSTVACTSYATVTGATDYSDLLCDLPACSQVNCQEIILYDNNSIGLVNSTKIAVKYFSDCDQNLLDMLETGDFLPDIMPASMLCDKAAKPWTTPGCTTTFTCNTSLSPAETYKDQKDCGTAAQYEKYSKTYTISAGP